MFARDMYQVYEIDWLITSSSGVRSTCEEI